LDILLTSFEQTNNRIFLKKVKMFFIYFLFDNVFYKLYDKKMEKIQKIYPKLLKNNIQIIGQAGMGKSILISDYLSFLINQKKNIINIPIHEQDLNKWINKHPKNNLFFLNEEKYLQNKYISHSIGIEYLFYKDKYINSLLNYCLSKDMKSQIIEELKNKHIDTDFFMKKNYYHQFFEPKDLENIHKWIQKGWISNLGDIDFLEKNYQIYFIDFRLTDYYFKNSNPNEYFYKFISFVSYILGEIYSENYYVFDEQLENNVQLFSKNNYQIEGKQRIQPANINMSQQIEIKNIQKNGNRNIVYQNQEYEFSFDEMVQKEKFQNSWLSYLKHVYEERYKLLKNELIDNKINHEKNEIKVKEQEIVKI
jgi:hypothetical protein